MDEILSKEDIKLIIDKYESKPLSIYSKILKSHEALRKEKNKLELLKQIVSHQADMESLWMLTPTFQESILTAALRHLHAVIEQDEVMAEMSKKHYWDLESEL